MKEKIIKYLEEHGKTSVNDLAAALDMAGAKAFPKLIKTISNLESHRQLRFDDNGSLSLQKKEAKKKEITVRGLFRANKAGFGFLSIDQDEDDMFIGKNDIAYAIDGDTVEAVVKKPADRLNGTAAEARVVNIVERSLKTLVGKFVLDDERPKYAGYIKSKNQKINQKIYIRKEPVVLDGTEIIKVDIDKYPTRGHDYFVASVRDIVGHQGDVGIDVLEVLESMDIVSEFPEDVIAEANAIPDAPTEKDLIGRVDLRQEVTFTIDGADAKDLDDAVHIKLLDNGHFELGVHIADVSYYVTEGSALNREALSRGTSVYVTDRVVPMLPERLSNGICSLNPNLDRLTQSCIMEIDQNGRVVNHQITQSVINTTYRMTYTAVNDIIAGDEEICSEYESIVSSVQHMVTLHHTLEAMRTRRGALNFDTSEAKIMVNDKGMPVDIVIRNRGIAERMIESFMLAANETVAEHYARLKLPFIYRIHEEPKAEKLQKFIDYASVFGVQIQGTATKITQSALQDFMKKVQGQPGSEVLSMMLLRSMQQARYSEHNHGHYGLAAEYYTHFTSPIRRYPDLLVHRMIRDYDDKAMDKADHFANLIPEIATQTSSLERRAIDAERIVEAMKKAEYMEEYVGEEFEGVVASVVKFGMFVELPNTIEGLIHVTTLPEYYHFNERTLTLQGEKSGKVFRVGQQIKVKLIRSDKETGDIDFDYLPSDFDIVEKVSKSSREGRPNRSSKREHQHRISDRDNKNKNTSKKKASRKPKRNSDSKSHHHKDDRTTGSTKKKTKKPFYKGVAKKGQKRKSKKG
ncbi:TPA: ribonuclease R [Streptococcus agalactiae]|jgi:RNAse R (EC 3.1.-.-)|uniref:Ribonuclease R n=7 Tax=Streptococcus agalactiae TaxID=1311 RepID=Q8DYJ8_STRA5|nr:MULTISPECIES: ribonuclease R [Streptococcus]EAO61831.1 ribonuclease R [Streptococcus agalactiae 18RS21]MEE3844328.1 ribonuclease R [Streptococcus sp. R4]HEO2249363.1 ribonuclease R [Streptococcus agalactiae 515]HEO8209113.1 ribonuclease R [Streptococcus agalactiae ADL-350]AAN00349.1 exoribonuclease, VacB/Rnb family [Streptococcus agalactiae 2603V/R]